MRHRTREAHFSALRPQHGHGAPWLALVMLCAALGIAPVAAQTIPLVANPVDLPTVTVASADVSVADHQRVVWLVQTDASQPVPGLSHTESQLELLVVQDGASTMPSERGAMHAEVEEGHGRRLPHGWVVPLTGTGGADLRVRITLVDARLLPDQLPAGVIASEPFAAPGAGVLHIELRRGALAPAQQALIQADEAPALLLALDNPLRVEAEHEPTLVVSRGALTFLPHNATVRNPGAHNAAFIVTWLDPGANTAAGLMTRPLPDARDAALDDAWRHNGCHLNPGNPACLTVSLAATCASEPTLAGCDTDSDRDTCRDVAEVRAGLDPFDPGDCLGAGDGSPLLNCLFLAGNLACDGSESTSAKPACAADVDAREGPLPAQSVDCDPTTRFPSVDCGLIARDPTCAGIDLGGGRSTGR